MFSRPLSLSSVCSSYVHSRRRTAIFRPTAKKGCSGWFAVYTRSWREPSRPPVLPHASSPLAPLPPPVSRLRAVSYRFHITQRDIERNQYVLARSRATRRIGLDPMLVALRIARDTRLRRRSGRRPSAFPLCVRAHATRSDAEQATRWGNASTSKPPRLPRLRTPLSHRDPHGAVPRLIMGEATAVQRADDLCGSGCFANSEMVMQPAAVRPIPNNPLVGGTLASSTAERRSTTTEFEPSRAGGTGGATSGRRRVARCAARRGAEDCDGDARVRAGAERLVDRVDAARLQQAAEHGQRDLVTQGVVGGGKVPPRGRRGGGRVAPRGVTPLQSAHSRGSTPTTPMQMVPAPKHSAREARWGWPRATARGGSERVR